MPWQKMQQNFLSNLIIKTMRGELNTIKLRDGRFSITFDESTSMRNRQYMNINVHFQGGFRSLKMICIPGSLMQQRQLNWLKNRQRGRVVKAPD